MHICCFRMFLLRASADPESQIRCCSGQQVWMRNTALDGYFQAACELNNGAGAGEHFQSRPQSAAEASRPDNRGECTPPPTVQNADKYVIRRWYGKLHQSRLMFWLKVGRRESDTSSGLSINGIVCRSYLGSLWQKCGWNLKRSCSFYSGICINNIHFSYSHGLGC